MFVALLAGCGSDDTVGGGSDDPVETADASGPVEGELTISQWPFFIDPGKNGTVADFEAETGVEVKYLEDINDNQQFFGKLQPLLENGESGGRSLITVSDWLAAQMYDLGYLQKLDYSKLPNVEENLIPALQQPRRRPRARVHRPLAERYDRAHRAHRRRSRGRFDLRPLRPQVQGPSDDAGRDCAIRCR